MAVFCTAPDGFYVDLGNLSFKTGDVESGLNIFFQNPHDCFTSMSMLYCRHAEGFSEMLRELEDRSEEGIQYSLSQRSKYNIIGTTTLQFCLR